jgi:hypothetical protein
MQLWWQRYRLALYQRPFIHDLIARSPIEVKPCRANEIFLRKLCSELGIKFQCHQHEHGSVDIIATEPSELREEA